MRAETRTSHARGRHIRNGLALTALAALVVALLFTVPASAAKAAGAPAAGDHPRAAEPVLPAVAPNDMHPAFLLRDGGGAPLAPHGGTRPSAAGTCGACHDASFIAAHTTHPPDKTGADCFTCHVRGGAEAVLAAERLADGRVRPTIAPPDAAVCGRCHGLAGGREATVELAPEFLKGAERGPFGTTLRTGEVFSPQRVSDSFLNLTDKSGLDRAWDVHAARKLDCTSCHFAANNPEKSGFVPAAGAPRHLVNDPRKLTTAAYLKRPDHRLAGAACTDCHDPTQTHASLPSAERHMAALACQACHVPLMAAPALRAADHTVVTADGGPRLEFRGVEQREFAAPSTWYLNGYRPFLLSETRDGRTRFAPYNLVARWDWIHDAAGADGEKIVEIVPTEALDRAWRTASGVHHPELVAAFDGDGDGALADAELLLDSDAKVAAIRGRLEAQGLANPRIRGEIQAHAVRHGVVEGRWTASDCGSCHGAEARFDDTIVLTAAGFPGGVTPSPTPETEGLLGDRGVETVDGTLQVAGSTEAEQHYILGHSRRPWSDLAGFAIFVLTVLGIAGHGGLRWRGRRRRPESADASAHHGEMKRVYMYGAYERVWHWTMAFSIVVLLLTGFQIHYPEALGLMSFSTAVFVHNIMAVVMMLNAALSLFYHLATGEIRQFVPQREGLIGRLIEQAMYYGKGIFVGAVHPSAKTPERKLNPLQQLTYVGLLNVLFPLQILTGILMWVGGTWPGTLDGLGGLAVLAPLHNLGSWLFLTFLVMHVYLTTTGHTLTSNLKAMVDGWEDIPADELKSAPQRAAVKEGVVA